MKIEEQQPEYCILRTKQVSQRMNNMHNTKIMHLIFRSRDCIKSRSWSYLLHPHCQKVVITSLESWIPSEMMYVIDITTIYWRRDITITLASSAMSMFSSPEKLSSAALATSTASASSTATLSAPPHCEQKTTA